MKGVFNTNCIETVVHQLVRLYEASDALAIKGWVEQTLEKLPRKVPNASRCYF